MWFIELGLHTCLILKHNRFLTTAIFTGFASTVHNAFHRVTTDLENLEKSGNFGGNLKETSKSRGISHRIPKLREFSCLKFIFNQVEDPDFEDFLGEHATRPPKWSGTHGRA